jgi:hypothetical protein
VGGGGGGAGGAVGGGGPGGGFDDQCVKHVQVVGGGPDPPLGFGGGVWTHSPPLPCGWSSMPSPPSRLRMALNATHANNY